MSSLRTAQQRATQLASRSLASCCSLVALKTLTLAPHPHAPQQAGRPSLSPYSSSHAQMFSSSPSLGKRYNRTRENNPLRGISTIYRRGPRRPLTVSGEPLPRPRRFDIVEEARKRMDPEHPLWEFFYNKQLAGTPALLGQHGRAWTVEELRQKGWDDLHKLWWACCKERNRIQTTVNMINEKRLGFGKKEADDRDHTVRRTMKCIKHVLTERWYAWEDAVELAKKDPEVNMSGKGQAYTPKDYLEKVDPVAAVDTDEAKKDIPASI